MTKITDSKLDFLQPDIYTGIVKPNPYTTDQINAINQPQQGWLVENTTANALWRYDGSGWKDITGSAFNAFVGDGYEYEDLSSAIADGKDRIAVVGNVTETISPVAPVTTVNLTITWFVNYETTVPFNFNNCNNVKLIGMSGATVKFSFEDTASNCILMTADSLLILQDMRVINSSIVAAAFPNNTAIRLLAYNTYYSPSFTNQSFIVQGSRSRCIGLTIVTVGAASGTILQVLNNSYVQNLNCEGDMNISYRYIIVDGRSTITDYIFTFTANKTYDLQVKGYLNNGQVISDPSGVLNIIFSGESRLNGLQGDYYTAGGNVKFSSFDYNRIQLLNLDQCGQGLTNTWTGDLGVMQNCDYWVNLIVTGGSHMFVNSNVSGERTGTSKTIDLQAGSDNNIVSNIRTDSAIVNSGANNSLGPVVVI